MICKSLSGDVGQGEHHVYVNLVCLGVRGSRYRSLFFTSAIIFIYTRPRRECDQCRPYSLSSETSRETFTRSRDPYARASSFCKLANCPYQPNIQGNEAFLYGLR